MKKSTIKKIIDQKNETIHDYVQLVEIHYYTKDIIRLRIEINKLKALLVLSSHHKNPDKLFDSPVNSRTILSQTGMILDLLLQIKKIKEACSAKDIPVKYINMLEQELKKRKLKYKEITYQKEKTKKDFIESITERLRKKYIRKYLKDRHSKLNLLIGKNQWDDETLNSIKNC